MQGHIYIVDFLQVWPIPCNFGAVVGHFSGVSLKFLLDWQSDQAKSTKSM